MNFSLFDEASRDFDAEAAQRRTAMVRVAVQKEIFPFLAMASTSGEYDHRKALAYERLSAIASRCEASLQETEAVADRMYAALQEGRKLAAGMKCANCGHSNSPHAQGDSCSSCGCHNFTPQTTAAKEGRRVTAEEGEGPFS